MPQPKDPGAVLKPGVRGRRRLGGRPRGCFLPFCLSLHYPPGCWSGGVETLGLQTDTWPVTTLGRSLSPCLRFPVGGQQRPRRPGVSYDNTSYLSSKV